MGSTIAFIYFLCFPSGLTHSIFIISINKQSKQWGGKYVSASVKRRRVTSDNIITFQLSPFGSGNDLICHATTLYEQMVL